MFFCIQTQDGDLLICGPKGQEAIQYFNTAEVAERWVALFAKEYPNAKVVPIEATES